MNMIWHLLGRDTQLIHSSPHFPRQAYRLIGQLFKVTSETWEQQLKKYLVSLGVGPEFPTCQALPLTYGCCITLYHIVIC